MLTLTTGERVLILRKRSGLTQSQLASRIGVNRLTVHGIENGHRAAAGDILLKMADVLSVEPSLLDAQAQA